MNLSSGNYVENIAIAIKVAGAVRTAPPTGVGSSE